MHDRMSFHPTFHRGDPLRERFEQLRYEELNWYTPRNTAEFVAAYIQVGEATTATPPYVGLLDAKSKAQFFSERAAAEKAYAVSKNPTMRMLELAETKYASQLIPPQVGISGNIFLSRAKLAEMKAGRHSGENSDKARISFNVNLARYVEFFEFMMGELSTGSLADIGLQFKMADAFPKDQGNGESAHLYFHSSVESKIYDALTQVIHPAMVRNQQTAVGGRLLMIPVVDKHGRALQGVEFGQGMPQRTSINTPERAQVLAKTRGSFPTSSIITYFTSTLNANPTLSKNISRLHRLVSTSGLDALYADSAFQELVTAQRRLAIALGRNPGYPILERNAVEVFPKFTKAIQG